MLSLRVNLQQEEEPGTLTLYTQNTLVKDDPSGAEAVTLQREVVAMAVQPRAR
jgi:hypothetical protein